MSTHELSQLAVTLIKAKRRILDVENWCQGAMRRGYQRCAWGAIEAVTEAFNCKASYDDYTDAVRVLDQAAIELFGITAVGVNEMKGHAEVHQVYDRAIQKAIKP